MMVELLYYFAIDYLDQFLKTLSQCIGILNSVNSSNGGGGGVALTGGAAAGSGSSGAGGDIALNGGGATDGVGGAVLRYTRVCMPWSRIHKRVVPSL